MAGDYNSKLISTLYSSEDPGVLVDTLGEITKIKDPIFLYPLKDSYFKHNNKSFDHYIIDAIGSIDGSEAILALEEIFLSDETGASNAVWALDSFMDRSYFGNKIVLKAKSLLEKVINGFFRAEQEYLRYEVDSLLKFLSKAKKISVSDIDLLVQKLIDSEKYSLSMKDKKYFLQTLLDIDKDNTLKFILDNLDKILKEKTVDVVLTEVIKTWSGPKSDKIKEKIKKQGSSRVVEIISDYEDKKNKEEESKKNQDKKLEKEEFPNSKIIYDISDLFDKINKFFEATDLGLPVFVGFSPIFNELKVVDSKDSLTSSCVRLRSILEKIEKSLYEKSGIKKEDQNNIFPKEISPENYNKPLNRLFLYLYSLNKDTDVDLYGLRILNSICTKIGSHTEDVKSISEVLDSANLLNLWKQEDFNGLHNSLLLKFKDSLEKILNLVSKQEK